MRLTNLSAPKECHLFDYNGKDSYDQAEDIQNRIIGLQKLENPHTNLRMRTKQVATKVEAIDLVNYEEDDNTEQEISREMLEIIRNNAKQIQEMERKKQALYFQKIHEIKQALRKQTQSKETSKSSDEGSTSVDGSCESHPIERRRTRKSTQKVERVEKVIKVIHKSVIVPQIPIYDIDEIRNLAKMKREEHVKKMAKRVNKRQSDTQITQIKSLRNSACTNEEFVTLSDSDSTLNVFNEFEDYSYENTRKIKIGHRHQADSLPLCDIKREYPQIQCVKIYSPPDNQILFDKYLELSRRLTFDTAKEDPNKSNILSEDIWLRFLHQRDYDFQGLLYEMKYQADKVVEEVLQMAKMVKSKREDDQQEDNTSETDDSESDYDICFRGALTPFS